VASSDEYCTNHAFGGENRFDEHTVVRPKGAESVGYALLVTASDAAEALTGGPRSFGCGRMRGPSVASFVFGGVVAGAGALFTADVGLLVVRQRTSAGFSV
jgi:hypothetical protein